MAKEILGATLISIHNLTFLTGLMAGARTAIEAGNGAFSAYKTETLTSYYITVKETERR